MAGRWTVAWLLLLGPLVGCQGTGTQLSEEQRTAAGGGIALIAGGSFGQVVGAGLVGGAAG